MLVHIESEHTLSDIERWYHRGGSEESRRGVFCRKVGCVNTLSDTES